MKIINEPDQPAVDGPVSKRVPWEELFLDREFSVAYAEWAWNQLPEVDYVFAMEREGAGFPALLTLTTMYDLETKGIVPFYIRKETSHSHAASAFVGVDPYGLEGKKVAFLAGSVTSGFLLVRMKLLMERFGADLAHVIALVDRRNEYRQILDKRVDDLDLIFWYESIEKLLDNPPG